MSRPEPSRSQPLPTEPSGTDGAAMAARRRPRQIRIRTVMQAVALVAIGLAILRTPGGIVLVFWTVAGLVIVANGFLGLMALGWLGFGLFALAERLGAWVGRAGRWPDDAEPPVGL